MAMRICQEYDRDEVLTITAIPVADYSLGTHAWQVEPLIPNTQFSPPLTNAIVIGLQPAVAGGKLIPIKRNTGSAKDSEDDSVAGRKHSVSVDCEADDRDPETWNTLLKLERTPCHLLLTFRNGTQGFASCTQDSYECDVDRDGAKTSVKFKLDNYMGIQLITR